MAIATPTPEVSERVPELVSRLTLTTTEVADWHFLDITLTIDRNRPLIALLFELAFAPSEPCVDLRDPEPGLAIA